jgi:hypothetical protein
MVEVHPDDRIAQPINTKRVATAGVNFRDRYLQPGNCADSDSNYSAMIR